MTTIVKVEAHCNPETTCVKVTKTTSHGPDFTILPDGDSADFYVHDLDMIRVQEIPLEPGCAERVLGDTDPEPGASAEGEQAGTEEGDESSQEGENEVRSEEETAGV